MNHYINFLQRKTHVGSEYGFAPTWMPSKLFPFQVALTEWALRKGRAATFADCGLGKTFQQLVWAENVAQKTDKPVLILTPLSVAFQTVREGAKLDLEVEHLRDGLGGTSSRLVVTNYERLHHFAPSDFGGVVCDESSILKNFDGATRQAVTDFMRKIPYRALYTATAAPNDYIELGTSSDALGELGYMDMLNRFFKRDKVFVKLYNRGGQGWHFRGHAEHDFWRWVCSWARAMRKPSDMGFDDADFKLPELIVRAHKVTARRKAEGMLFELPASGLQEQREELHRTVNERCEMSAELINAHKKPAIAWCHLNTEAKLLKKLIPGSVDIEGSDSEDSKEEAFRDFVSGKVRVIVTKPTIASLGLNFQHCAHMTFFPSHSYEQYYQATRRCWRFGQKRPVTVDLISTDGQANVLANLKRKTEAADVMFEHLVALMMDELKIKRQNDYTKQEEVPSWLSKTKP
jgi:hypothetical protein